MLAPIKNTFVHFGTSDENTDQLELCCSSDYVVRRRTKRSATAPSAAMQLIDEGEQLSDGCTALDSATTSDRLGSLSSCSTGDEDNPSSEDESLVGLHGDDIFDRTPTASEFVTRFNISRGTQLEGAREDSGSHSAVTGQSSDAGAQKQMLVEVPISVPAEFAANATAFGNRIQVTLLQTLAQSNVDGTSEDVVVDLRFRLSVAASEVPAVPVPLLLAEAVPPIPTSAPPAKSPSTSAVCCHWKQKGWCAYQNTCKFSHPEHKRGVGAGSSSKKNRQRGANQNQSTVAPLHLCA
jgi:hypothetical protein